MVVVGVTNDLSQLNSTAEHASSGVLEEKRVNPNLLQKNTAKK